MIYDGYRRGEYNYKPTNTNEGSRRMDSLVAVFKTKAAMVWLIQANERIGRWMINLCSQYLLHTRKIFGFLWDGCP